MEAPANRPPEPGQVWDNLDVDLVVKVLANTVFSPFFIFFIPVFYVFQGAKLTDAIVIGPALYCVAISAFWGLRWYSQLYRNQGSLFFAPPKLDWGEQIVVVTGGASGIGELIANTLAVRHVNVVVLDVNPIITENYNITYYQCDVSKWEEVDRVSKQIVKEVGHPTILINNAGVVQGKLLLDLTLEDVNQTFGVNTLAHFWTLKAFLPEMVKKNAGHVVTISSVLSMAGAARVSDYAASKAAHLPMHEALRFELDKKYGAPGVRTTLVCPGYVLTPLVSRATPPTSALYRFLLPALQPITVAKAVITALDETHSKTLYLPFYVNFAWLLRPLPSFMRDFVQWVTAADTSMDEFVKTTGLRPDEEPARASERPRI